MKSNRASGFLVVAAVILMVNLACNIPTNMARVVKRDVEGEMLGAEESEEIVNKAWDGGKHEG